MPAPKTVTALLAQQDEEVLAEMLESLDTDIRRMTIEKEQVQEALAKKRSRRGGRRVGGETSRGHSGVKRQDVLRIVRAKGKPTTPADVRHSLLMEGYDITGAAVRNHLRRLVEDNELVTDGEGEYALRENGLTRNGSGDPLFMDSQNQSESLS
jgi:hypothetical protein